jgi:predicted dehydrogenase
VNDLRVGITGYGLVGTRRHRVIDDLPNARVVAISDIKFDEAPVRRNGVDYFHRFEQLLESDLDVLFVCLPNDTAPDVTIAGLERGLHVFCEKPPGRTVADVKRVIAAERQHLGSKLKYGFNHRYHSSVRDALQVVRSGELGGVLSLRGLYGKSAIIPWPRQSSLAGGENDDVVWRTSRELSGGGILLDQGIHMVDLMRIFAGGEFTKVMSIVRNTYWNHDVEDNAYALMSTAQGVVAMLHSTATQWRHTFALEISLAEGALQLAGILSGTRSYGDESLTTAYRGDSDQGRPREQRTTYIHDTSWRDEVVDFFDAIENDAPIAIGTSDEALKTMELVYQIYCADDEWRDRYNLSVE